MKTFRTILVTIVACLVSSAAMAETPRFSGLYFGVNGGADFGNMKIESPLTIDGLAATGGFAGVHVGYDLRMQNFVFGVGAEYTWSNAEFKIDPGILKAGIDESWAVYGRVGVPLNETVMPYVLAGYTESKGKLEVPLATFTAEETLKGYFLGGGVEFYLTNLITASVEYRYVNFDAIELAPGANLDVDGHRVRAALNVRLDGTNPFSGTK